MAKKKVLITGGAGFLGINLVRYLLERDCEVTILDLEPFTYPEKDRIHAVQGDIRDRALVDECMENQGFVVHTAAALPLYTPEEIFTTDVVGTRNVMVSAREHNVDRAVQISSTAVYGIPDHHPLYEDDRLEGVGPYGEAKIQAEVVCLEQRGRGLCCPIIRPKSFVGPERLGVFALLYDWAVDGRNFPMIGNGKNRYQLLDVEDLCEAIWLCLTLEKDMVNDTFNIGAEEYTTMGEDWQAVLDAAGHGGKIIPFPASPAIIGLRTLEALKLSPLYKWVYETASTDSFVSIDRAKSVLGYSPKFSNKQALIRNFDWYVANMDKFRDATDISGRCVTHRVPWKQGILSVVKKFF